MTREQVIKKFTEMLDEMSDSELNYFTRQDSKRLWTYHMEKNRITGEWDVKMW